MKITPKIVDLAQKMADHTAPVCQNFCRCPRSCCSPEYCEAAKLDAQEAGVTLEQQRSEGLLFMGPNGCTVPPHLRITCTLHVCCVNALGFKPGDQEWTDKYYNLREELFNEMYDDSNNH